MGREKIIYTCGHEGIVRMYGNLSMRQRRIEYLSTCLCPECYKNKIESIRTQRSEAAKKASEEQGLPKLTGTPKQVAWAETLRQEFLDLDWMNDTVMNNLALKALETFSASERTQIDQNIPKIWREFICDAIVNYGKKQSEAEWFIERRDKKETILYKSILNYFKNIIYNNTKK